jgi:hypothetical protein
MKHLAKLFSLLLMLGLVLTLVACIEEDDDDPIEVTPINMLGDWADSGDGVYATDINSTNALSFTFNKQNFPWAAMVKDVTESLDEMQTLFISIQGSGVAVLIKLEGEGGLDREVQINANAAQQTFAWTFEGDEDFLLTVEKMLVFAAPGAEGVSGNVLISRLEFSPDEATGNVIESGHSDFVAPDPNIYDGEADTFQVINWYDGGDGVYDVTETNGSYEVSYNKTTEMHHWSFIRADIQGQLSNFAKVVFVMTGVAEQTALLKVEGPEGNKELPVVFDGTEQTFVVDLSTLANSVIDALDKIVIFGTQGSVGVGEFTIHSVTFEKALTDINSGWYPLDEGDYVVTENMDGSVDVEFNKVEREWSLLKLDIDPALSNLNTLELVIQGEAGLELLIKPNDSGALEQFVTLEDDQPLTLTYTADQFSSILIFAFPGVIPAEGSFKIISATLDFVPKAFDPTLVYNFNNDYTENDPGTYSFSVQEDDSVKVTYVQSGWNFMRRNFDVTEVAGLNTMTVVLSGTPGRQVLLKPNDSGALETWVTFEDTEPVTVVVHAGQFVNLLVFAEAGTAAMGSFTIHEAYLSYTHVITEWQANEQYTITENNGAYDVTYNKDGNPWALFRVDFLPETFGLNTLTITLSGEVGQSVLIKPNDSGALEKTVTFENSEPVTVEFKADTFTTIIVFGSPGDAAATGTFTVHSAVLTYVPISFDPDTVLNLNVNHVSGDPEVYTFTQVGDEVLVDYNKIAGQEWSFLRMNVDQEQGAGLNTLTIVLKGQAGQAVLIKPNDSGALEHWVNFTDEEPVTVVIHNASFISVLMFAEAGTAPAEGEFTIVSAELSFSE